jgi:uncharacterized membrane protein
MKALTRILISGLLTVLPIAVTLAVLAWLAGTLEGVLGGILDAILPEGAYATGMGFATGLVLVFLVGLLTNTWLARRLFARFEHAFLSVPVIKVLYSAIKDVVAMFSPDKERQFDAVVTYRIPGTDVKLIGFVTRDSTEDLPGGLGGPDIVAVYLPLSYQIGGYMLLLPRDQVEAVDIPVTNAMRLALTAGVTGG